MRFVTLALAAALASTSSAAAEDLPKDNNVLFWTQAQRDAAFRVMEKLTPTNEIVAGGKPHRLVQGKPLAIKTDMAAYMAEQRNAGLIIVHRGKIRFEEYGLGLSGKDRWTSFSVAKSITSTLVGAAIRDGYVKSLDDKVTNYIPDLRGSAYDDVSVRQLLTMTSGVKWSENYFDPKSDVALFTAHKAEPGVDVTVSYMRKLPRAAPAGSQWVYKTGETNLIGVLVSSATGKTLSAYLSEKIWKPYGMEAPAVWMLGSTGHEVSGCCFSAVLRDFARFGQFILDGGKGVLPRDWLARATRKQVETGSPGSGYGYQWWTKDDASFSARGIFGQAIFIDPKRQLVIASNGNWPLAVDSRGVGAKRDQFHKVVQAAIDSEGR